MIISTYTAEDIARALPNNKRVGNNKYMASCPAHEDKNPSFSIKQGNDGKPLFHCFAGCPQTSVLKALQSMGVWQAQRSSNRPNPEIYQNEYRLCQTVINIAISDLRSHNYLSWSDKDRGAIINAVEKLETLKKSKKVREYYNA